LCEAGHCISDCEPGTRRCRPDRSAQAQTCNPEGVWQDLTLCVNAVCREGACRGECEPNQRRCDPNDEARTQVCNAEGTWVAKDSCGSARCTGAGVCEPPAGGAGGG
jgi:hypothetical protein